MLDFLKDNLELIIMILTGSTVIGQGFHVVFKNLKVNKNFADLEKIVNQVLKKDISSLISTLKDIKDEYIKDLDVTKEEFNEVIKGLKEDLKNERNRLVEIMKKNGSTLESIKDQEINRLKGIIKNNFGDEDVL